MGEQLKSLDLHFLSLSLGLAQEHNLQIQIFADGMKKTDIGFAKSSSLAKIFPDPLLLVVELSQYHQH
ncbi:MAG: hypothetical protein EBR82_53560 [Caulobacteraceae bacterium]|nr:hypothetical protein [Caulobacteraceae bacterium]